MLQQARTTLAAAHVRAGNLDCARKEIELAAGRGDRQPTTRVATITVEYVQIRTDLAMIDQYDRDR